MPQFTIKRRIPGTLPPQYNAIAVPVRWKTLAEAIYLSGLFRAPALCSGLGHCGRCRVRFVHDAPEPDTADRAALGHHALDAGWRLSCTRPAQAGICLELPDEVEFLPRADNAGAGESHQPVTLCSTGESQTRGGSLEAGDTTTNSSLFLAVDCGTTSLHWQLLDRDGGTVDAGVETNPQMGAGSDVISRIGRSLDADGRLVLSGLVRDALTRITAQRPVSALCFAANPAMTAIFLNRDVSGLAAAPYRLDYPGGSWEDVPGLPPIYVPPQVSAFVGGDITAGYASLALDPARSAPAFPFLLADLGTNGEFLLALDPDKALAASVPMGPALEGINLACGMEAAHGAVTRFSVTPLGLEPLTMGETAPRGISGTGYLSLIQGLLRTGFLDRQGHFCQPGAGSLAARMARPDESGSMSRIRLPGRLFLTAGDVEEILKVKAAFSVAVSWLLAEAGLAPSSLSAIYLAGSLGLHIPEGSLEELGFIPSGLGSRVNAVGNSSLAGAALLIRDEAARQRTLAWSRNVRTSNLAGSPQFGIAFAEHMRFAWMG